MKRKLVSNVLMMTMTAMLLTACTGSSEPAKEDVGAAATQTQEAAVMEASKPQEVAEAVPETRAEDFTYTGLQDGTIEVQVYNGTAEVVSIPAQIEGKDVSVIGDACFMNNGTITSIEIPDTVKEIGTNAFMNCDKLAEVKMSANVEVIGTHAFMGPDIIEIVLPDTLKEMGESVFSSCTLKSIEIPSSLTEIKGGTFINSDLESLV